MAEDSSVTVHTGKAELGQGIPACRRPRAQLDSCQACSGLEHPRAAGLQFGQSPKASGTSGRAAVQSHSARAEGSDLQQTAGHGQVLQEVDELILVTQGAVKEDRGEHAEDCQRSGYGLLRERETGRNCGRLRSLLLAQRECLNSAFQC